MDPLLIDIAPGQVSEAVALAVIQRWLKQACINANIPTTP
jgi:hypothetical protein